MYVIPSSPNANMDECSTAHHSWSLLTPLLDRMTTDHVTNCFTTGEALSFQGTLSTQYVYQGRILSGADVDISIKVPHSFFNVFKYPTCMLADVWHASSRSAIRQIGQHFRSTTHIQRWSRNTKSYNIDKLS